LVTCAGFIEEMPARGLTVSIALLELANALPSEAVPETAMRYTVGFVASMDKGIGKVTRRVVPATVTMTAAFG
jgi:hypothetical protein